MRRLGRSLGLVLVLCSSPADAGFKEFCRLVWIERGPARFEGRLQVDQAVVTEVVEGGDQRRIERLTNHLAGRLTTAHGLRPNLVKLLDWMLAQKNPTYVRVASRAYLFHVMIAKDEDPAWTLNFWKPGLRTLRAAQTPEEIENGLYLMSVAAEGQRKLGINLTEMLRVKGEPDIAGSAAFDAVVAQRESAITDVRLAVATILPHFRVAEPERVERFLTVLAMDSKGEVATRAKEVKNFEGKTASELRWSLMTEAERRAVLERLPAEFLKAHPSFDSEASLLIVASRATRSEQKGKNFEFTYSLARGNGAPRARPEIKIEINGNTDMPTLWFEALSAEEVNRLREAFLRCGASIYRRQEWANRILVAKSDGPMEYPTFMLKQNELERFMFALLSADILP